jgi:hypothetical protein
MCMRVEYNLLLKKPKTHYMFLYLFFIVLQFNITNYDLI